MKFSAAFWFFTAALIACGLPLGAADEAAKGGKDAKDNKNVMQTAASTSSIWQRMLWGTKLTVGVNNAFDRYPPIVLGAFNDNYDTANYSIRNRYWYVSLTKKF